MKFNNFTITSAHTLDLDVSIKSPVCVFCGLYSELVLDLMRELIGDFGAVNDPDRIDGGSFVLHADIEMDGKDYAVCYIRNAETMGDNRIAVNFTPNGLEFSSEDTLEFIKKCKHRNIDDKNVLDRTTSCASDDDRPIFVYGYFDRLDESIDVTAAISELASLGKQVFISVCKNYPIQKLCLENVQIESVE